MSCKYGPEGELVGRIPCPMGTCSWWGRPDNLPAHHIAKHGDAAMPPHNTKKKQHIPLPDGSMPPKPASKKRPRCVVWIYIVDGHPDVPHSDSSAGKIPIPTQPGYDMAVSGEPPMPVVYDHEHEGDADAEGEADEHSHRHHQPHDPSFLHEALSGLQEVAAAAIATPSSIPVPADGGADVPGGHILPSQIDSSFFATPAPILDHHHHHHDVGGLQADVPVQVEEPSISTGAVDGDQAGKHEATLAGYPSAWMRGESADIDALANVGPPLPPPRQ
jgi:hypothetical protein